MGLGYLSYHDNLAEEELFNDLVNDLEDYKESAYPEGAKILPRNFKDRKQLAYARWTVEAYIEMLEDLPFFAPEDALIRFTYNIVNCLHRAYEINNEDAKLQFSTSVSVIRDIEAYISIYEPDVVYTPPKNHMSSKEELQWATEF